ncbi:hypothetical protein V4B17_01225 [Bartonella sp. B23]
MVKIFKNYVLGIFIAYAFFISQIVNVNANYLRNGHQKEDTFVFLMEQAGNAESQAINMTALYASTLDYEMENGAIIEGTVERVVEPITIGTGLLIAGHVVNLISAIIGWVKEILSMVKQSRSV